MGSVWKGLYKNVAAMQLWVECYFKTGVGTWLHRAAKHAYGMVWGGGGWCSLVGVPSLLGFGLEFGRWGGGVRDFFVILQFVTGLV